MRLTTALSVTSAIVSVAEPLIDTSLSEVGGDLSEVGGDLSEVGGDLSEVGGDLSDVGSEEALLATDKELDDVSLQMSLSDLWSDAKSAWTTATCKSCGSISDCNEKNCPLCSGGTMLKWIYKLGFVSSSITSLVNEDMLSQGYVCGIEETYCNQITQYFDDNALSNYVSAVFTVPKFYPAGGYDELISSDSDSAMPIASAAGVLLFLLAAVSV